MKRLWPKRLIGDKAYDFDPLDETLKVQGIELIASHSKNRKNRKTQDGRKLRRYKRRWKIERMFAWLQSFRRLMVHYEYKNENFLRMTQLGCIIILSENVHEMASRPKRKNPNRAGTDARKPKDSRYETRVTLNIPAGCRRLSLYVAPAEEANNKKFQALADQAKGILFSAPGRLTVDEDHKRALLATSFEIRSPFLVGPASQVSWVKGARRALPRLPTVKFGRGEAFRICR